MKVKKLGDITERIILQSLTKSHENYIEIYKLNKAWNSIIGENIARMVRVSEVRTDGVMILKLNKHSYAVEVNSYKELIIDRINTHFGKNYVSEVVIVS